MNSAILRFYESCVGKGTVKIFSECYLINLQLLNEFMNLFEIVEIFLYVSFRLETQTIREKF